MESKVKSARISKMIQFYHSNENIQTVFMETKSVLCTAKCLIVSNSSLIFFLNIFENFLSNGFSSFLNKEGREFS